MELSRIIFKDQEVWRAYKNREMIWHQQELKFFDIGNTELFAMPIITYGQDISKKVAAGFILHEITSNLNFAIDRGKNWENSKAFETLKDISINNDLGQKINNLDCFYLRNEYDANIDKAKRNFNTNAILFYNQYKFNIDFVGHIKKSESLDFYGVHPIYIDVAKKAVKSHTINFLSTKVLNIDKANKIYKGAIIQFYSTKKLNSDLAKKIKRKLIIDFSTLTELKIDLAKRLQGDLFISFYNLEKIYADLAKRLEDNFTSLFSSVVYEHIDKGKKTYGDPGINSLNTKNIYSDVAKMWMDAFKMAFLLENAIKLSQAKGIARDQYLSFCNLSEFLQVLSKQQLTTQKIDFVQKTVLREVIAEKNKKEEQIKISSRSLESIDLARLLYYFFDFAFLIENNFMISLGSKLYKRNYTEAYAPGLLGNSKNQQIIKVSFLLAKNQSLLSSSFVKGFIRINDIFTDCHKPNFISSLVNIFEKKDSTFLVIESSLNCSWEKMIKQNEAILLKNLSLKINPSKKVDWNNIFLILVKEQSEIINSSTKKTKILNKIILQQESAFLASPIRQLLLDIFNYSKSESELRSSAKQQTLVQSDSLMFILNELKSEYAAQSAVMHTQKIREESIYYPEEKRYLITNYRIANKEKSSIRINHTERPKTNFAINSLNNYPLLKEEIVDQILAKNFVNEIGYFIFHLRSFINKFDTKSSQKFYEQASLSFLETIKDLSSPVIFWEINNFIDGSASRIKNYNCMTLYESTPLIIERAVQKSKVENFISSLVTIVKNSQAGGSESEIEIACFDNITLGISELHDSLFSRNYYALQDLVRLSYGVINDTFYIQEGFTTDYNINPSASQTTAFNKQELFEGRVTASLEVGSEYKWLWPIWLNIEKTNLYIRQVNCFSYAEQTIK